MKKSQLLFMLAIILGFGIIFNACEKNLDYPIPDIEERIVVSGVLMMDSVINIEVSHSASIKVNVPYDQEDFLSLDDKTQVKVFENDVFIENLTYTELGKFSGEYNVKANKLYSLEVSHPDYPSVEVATTIPEPVSIISIDTATEYVSDGVETYREFLFNIKFKDSGDEKNFYVLSALTVENYDGDEHNYQTWLNSPQTELNVLNYQSNIIVSDDVFNGNEITLKTTGPSTYYHDVVDPNGGENYEVSTIFVLFSISEDYYKYLASRNLYQSSNDFGLFAEAVQVYSNVESGLGILGGASYSFKIYE